MKNLGGKFRIVFRRKDSYNSGKGGKADMFESKYRKEYGGLGIGRVERDENFTAPLKFYKNEYEIQYLISGRRLYFVNHECFSMEGGCLALVDKKRIPKTCIIGGQAHDRVLLEMKEDEFIQIGRLMGIDFAGLFARTAIVPYCAVRANLRACAAFLALGFVDMGNVVLIEAYCPEFAHVLASVSQTAAAGVGNLVSAHRTFVAGDVDNFDYVRVFLVAAHGDFYPFDNDCAFLINAATHRRDFARDDDFRNVRNGFQKLVLPSGPCDLSQDLVLQMLNFRVEFSHFITYNEPSKRRFLPECLLFVAAKL